MRCEHGSSPRLPQLGSWGLCDLAGWWIGRGYRAGGCAVRIEVCCEDHKSDLVISLALVSRACRYSQGAALGGFVVAPLGRWGVPAVRLVDPAG